MRPTDSRHGSRLEVLIGRSAALFVHPFAAWRSRSRRDRAVVVISYFAISYAIVFGLLQAV